MRRLVLAAAVAALPASAHPDLPNFQGRWAGERGAPLAAPGPTPIAHPARLGTSGPGADADGLLAENERLRASLSAPLDAYPVEAASAAEPVVRDTAGRGGLGAILAVLLVLLAALAVFFVLGLVRRLGGVAAAVRLGEGRVLPRLWRTLARLVWLMAHPFVALLWEAVAPLGRWTCILLGTRRSAAFYITGWELVTGTDDGKTARRRPEDHQRRLQARRAPAPPPVPPPSPTPQRYARPLTRKAPASGPMPHLFVLRCRNTA